MSREVICIFFVVHVINNFTIPWDDMGIVHQKTISWVMAILMERFVRT